MTFTVIAGPVVTPPVVTPPVGAAAKPAVQEQRFDRAGPAHPSVTDSPVIARA